MAARSASFRGVAALPGPERRVPRRALFLSRLRASDQLSKEGAVIVPRSVLRSHLLACARMMRAGGFPCTHSKPIVGEPARRWFPYSPAAIDVFARATLDRNGAANSGLPISD